MVLSAGGVASGWAGTIGCSAVGGVVLWVVVLSDPLPLSLQAATPNMANAETDARMSFLMISLLRKQRPVSHLTGGRHQNAAAGLWFRHIAFRAVTAFTDL